MGYGRLSAVFGYSRQAFYKRNTRQEKRAEENKVILDVVRQKRKREPKSGCRKIWREFKNPLLKNEKITLGRDRLFDLLRKESLLVKKKRNGARTTDSYHRFRIYGNLIKNMVLTKPHQVWVADITYISTLQGFCYLFLITDLYSRKVVGYHICRSLAVEGALAALRMAFRQLPKGVSVIHHSDRGIQYCCNAYVNILKGKGAKISMTEKDHVYENAVAERVNGILKGDLLLGAMFRDAVAAFNATKEAIQIYNEERLHVALGYITPAQKHAA